MCVQYTGIHKVMLKPVAFWIMIRISSGFSVNPSSANSTKWSNTLKQLVGCCRRIGWVCSTIFLELARKESNTLLFIIVLKALAREVRLGYPEELLWCWWFYISYRVIGGLERVTRSMKRSTEFKRVDSKCNKDENDDH